MRNLVIGFLLCALFGLAADNPVVGTWKVVSTGPNAGDEFNWTMTIKEQDGKLTGTLVGDMGEFQLTDTKYEDGTLKCKVAIDVNTYTIEAKVEGAKMNGTWKGITTGESGTIKGAKQA